MKKICTTFAFLLAWCTAIVATAQSGNTESATHADSVLLSERTDGDYLVRRYMIKNHEDIDYSVRYQINASDLSPTINGNNKELDKLGTFISGLANDTLTHLRSAIVTGYSSPDGPEKFNQTLAERRAQNFKSYLNKKYDFSKKYSVQVNSVAEDWEMCRTLVADSSIPDKEAVLRILDGKHSEAAKEAALRKLPAAWNYLKKNILPPLRRVELMINYSTGHIVELRTMIAKPKTEPAPKPTAAKKKPCCDVVIDESITGLIIEIPETKAEYRKTQRAAEREARGYEQVARKETKIVNKLTEEEARAMERVARKEAREAKKIAKAEAKAAKKSSKVMNKSRW